jgi:PAS domain S-box-containing protein
MFQAAAQQWEGMLREYALRGLGGQAQPYSPDEVAQAGHAVARLLDAVDEATGVNEVRVPLGDGLPRDVSLLQGVLDDALHLSSTGELLILRSLPEIVALRNWICDEVTAQAAGADPSPWRFSLAEGLAPMSAPEWDPALEPTGEIAWLLGDDGNSIVAASPGALALLGWTDDDLVGQRLLVVIPHHLREAHIAGFTHSVVSGGGDLLGQPLALEALTRDGTEVPITLTLTRHAARRGRTVYLAQIDPRG